MSEIDREDVGGYLESIRSLATIGIILIQLGKVNLIPTILEEISEHSQRLTLDYAVAEEYNGCSNLSKDK